VRRATTLDELVDRDRDHDCSGFGRHRVCVKVDAVADLPTRFGLFRIVAFWNNRDGKEHIALVHGDVMGAVEVPTRLHSECLTGDVMGSLRCDCRDQLESALRELGSRERGLLLYLRQEGRGIGLINKVRAYALQDGGLDTVDANRALGFRDDERDYSIAAHMLSSLDVSSVQLMTNNPDKVMSSSSSTAFGWPRASRTSCARTSTIGSIWRRRRPGLATTSMVTGSHTCPSRMSRWSSMRMREASSWREGQGPGEMPLRR
jgi:GTP cyclohydrolase II